MVYVTALQVRDKSSNPPVVNQICDPLEISTATPSKFETYFKIVFKFFSLEISEKVVDYKIPENLAFSFQRHYMPFEIKILFCHFLNVYNSFKQMSYPLNLYYIAVQC